MTATQVEEALPDSDPLTAPLRETALPATTWPSGADDILSIDCGEDDTLRTWVDWYTAGVTPSEDELSQAPSCTISAWESVLLLHQQVRVAAEYG